MIGLFVMWGAAAGAGVVLARELREGVTALHVQLRTAQLDHAVVGEAVGVGLAVARVDRVGVAPEQFEDLEAVGGGQRHRDGSPGGRGC